MLLDPSNIEYNTTSPASSSAIQDDRQGEDEDPAEDEAWDLPPREVGDIISVKVTCPVDQDNDVWAEIVDDFRAVVITAPHQYLPKLKAGDVIEEVKITGLRGQYFVCEAVPHLAVIYGEPEDFGNNEGDARNQP